MKGRRYVWSDPRIQELAKEFVPAADECGYLQARPARGPEAELFQKIAEQGHYAGRSVPTETRQGTYAAAPGGKLLASINSNDPDAMLDMLRRALAAWKALDPKDRLLPRAPAKNPEGRERLESQYPEGGLVLQLFSRDLPRKDGTTGRGWAGQAWNQDFAWFTKAEARSMIPETREPGARRSVPDALVRRLASRHLLDTVRGQTSPFRNDQVEKAELSLTVVKVEGETVHFRIEGTTRAVEGSRGYEPKILGRAAWDAKAERFSAFEMVAAGPRWGGTTYNVRRDDPGPEPMGIFFRLALTSEGPDRVAPAHAWNYFK